jgi:hypothetical protein
VSPENDKHNNDFDRNPCFRFERNDRQRLRVFEYRYEKDGHKAPRFDLQKTERALKHQQPH